MRAGVRRRCQSPRRRCGCARRGGQAPAAGGGGGRRRSRPQPPPLRAHAAAAVLAHARRNTTRGPPERSLVHGDGGRGEGERPLRMIAAGQTGEQQRRVVIREAQPANERDAEADRPLDQRIEVVALVARAETRVAEWAKRSAHRSPAARKPPPSPPPPSSSAAAAPLAPPPGVLDRRAGDHWGRGGAKPAPGAADGANGLRARKTRYLGAQA